MYFEPDPHVAKILHRQLQYVEDILYNHRLHLLVLVLTSTEPVGPQVE